MDRPLAMDLSEWEVDECFYWDGGVNCGVSGVMLGFGGTVIFIGRAGKYGSILSLCQIVSRCLLTSGSNPSIGDVLTVGGIPMVEVVSSVNWLTELLLLQ